MPELLGELLLADRSVVAPRLENEVEQQLPMCLYIFVPYLTPAPVDVDVQPARHACCGVVRHSVVVFLESVLGDVPPMLVVYGQMSTADVAGEDLAVPQMPELDLGLQFVPEEGRQLLDAGRDGVFVSQKIRAGRH